MSLIGKLAIAYLEEDNPIKSFFRGRPIALCEEQGWIKYETADVNFPTDGYLRIVPDKNEINQFKGRMRSMGLYCLMDLRKHPNENDKIRINKNHLHANGDANANIIYSDVVFKATPTILSEIIPVETSFGSAPNSVSTKAKANPSTVTCFLANDDRLIGPYKAHWDNENLVFSKIENVNLHTILVESQSDYMLDILLPNGERKQLLFDIDRFDITDEQLGGCELPKMPIFKPVSEIVIEVVNEITNEIVSKETIQAPAPVNQTITSDVTVKQAIPTMQEEQKPPVRQEVRDSWAKVNEATCCERHAARGCDKEFEPVRFKAQPIEKNNGRKGRNLHEIVEEQWRQQRYDQLGHPVPTDSTGKPIATPINCAINAFSSAWLVREARASLISTLLEDIEIREVIAQNIVGDIKHDCPESEAIRSTLENLEAERLHKLGELAALQKQREHYKNELFLELEESYSKKIKQWDEQNEKLQKTNAELSLRNTKLTKSLKEVTSEFNDIYGEGMNRTIRKLVADGKLFDTVLGTMYSNLPLMSDAPTVAPSRGAIISDLRTAFEGMGWKMSHAEAVNILICFTQSKINFISGAHGAGKSTLIRILAQVLGLPLGDRFAELHVAKTWSTSSDWLIGMTTNGLPLEVNPEVCRILGDENSVLPSLLSFNDANSADIERYAAPILHLCDKSASNEMRIGPKKFNLSDHLRLLLEVQDNASGNALPLKLLDSCFVLRLNTKTCDVDWKPATKKPFAANGIIDMNHLVALFVPSGEVPGPIIQRFAKLREALGVHGYYMSRRTMDDIWNYCATACELMQLPDIDVLDFAISQRVMLHLLSTADVHLATALPEVLRDLPKSLALIYHPLPIMPLY